jgi:hypothetical protein
MNKVLNKKTTHKQCTFKVKNKKITCDVQMKDVIKSLNKIGCKTWHSCIGGEYTFKNKFTNTEETMYYHKTISFDLDLIDNIYVDRKNNQLMIQWVRVDE